MDLPKNGIESSEHFHTIIRGRKAMAQNGRDL
jgi:hypothetical protein